MVSRVLEFGVLELPTDPPMNLDTFFENFDLRSLATTYLIILGVGECNGEPDLLISVALIFAKSFVDKLMVSMSVTVITGTIFS